MTHLDIAFKIISQEEGWRDKPYYCSEGYPTIGWGFKIGEKGEPLRGITMTHGEGDPKLKNWILGLDHDLVNDYHFSSAYAACNDVSKACLISMAYQLGLSELMQFKQTIELISKSYWPAVAEHIRGALAYKQTPARWERLAKRFESGIY